MKISWKPQILIFREITDIMVGTFEVLKGKNICFLSTENLHILLSAQYRFG